MADGAELLVRVKLSGRTIELEATPDLTVEALKALLEEPSGLLSEHQRLIYRGRVLRDEATLSALGYCAGTHLHLVRGEAELPSANGGADARNAAGSPSGGMDGTGAPPDVMRQMMNSTLMQGLLDNPEMLRSTMLANPQLRALSEANPELAHVLNDPALLRQSLETARNPNLMLEMMRNSDRAVANIEMHPEGFNMLRRMYSNIQQPLMEMSPSSILDADADADADAPAAATPTTPNTAALPNPWQPRNRPAAPAANPLLQQAHGELGGHQPLQSLMPSSLLAQLGGSHAPRPPPPAGARMPMPAARSPTDVSSGGGGAAAGAVPATQLYATQLHALSEMGFSDAEGNLRALVATGGNVQAAIEWLLSRGGSAG